MSVDRDGPQTALDASATAVSVAPGGRLEIRDSALTGSEYAVRVTGGTLALYGTTVRATKSTGLVVDGDGELTLVSSTVEAPPSR